MQLAWIFLIIAAGFNAGANVLLKSIGQTPNEAPVAIYFSPLFVLACGLFGLNLLAYTQTLKVMPLSIAYPMLVGISTLGLAVVSVLGFGETLTPPRILGYVLLVAALYMIGR